MKSTQAAEEKPVCSRKQFGFVRHSIAKVVAHDDVDGVGAVPGAVADTHAFVFGIHWQPVPATQVVSVKLAHRTSVCAPIVTVHSAVTRRRAAQYVGKYWARIFLFDFVVGRSDS